MARERATAPEAIAVNVSGGARPGADGARIQDGPFGACHGNAGIPFRERTRRTARDPFEQNPGRSPPDWYPADSGRRPFRHSPRHRAGARAAASEPPRAQTAPEPFWRAAT